MGYHPGHPNMRTPGPTWGPCWHCGTVQNLEARFCKSCTLNGKDFMMISCTDCGACRRRTRPGEQYFLCSACNTARHVAAREARP